jgi:hypothetical protein
VLAHDTVVFAAGSQTESVRMGTRELFGSEQVRTVPLVKQADRGGDDPVGRRRAAQQDVAGGGHQRRNAFPTGDALTDPSGLLPEVASSKV